MYWRRRAAHRSSTRGWSRVRIASGPWFMPQDCAGHRLRPRASLRSPRWHHYYYYFSGLSPCRVPCVSPRLCIELRGLPDCKPDPVPAHGAVPETPNQLVGDLRPGPGGFALSPILADPGTLHVVDEAGAAHASGTRITIRSPSVCVTGIQMPEGAVRPGDS